ncbi:MAG: hypothetical protein NDI73_01180 [Desulfuromonadales bacterium]|nr:hypothetical protein [Desulfuromonadales bacterium]
MTRCRIYLSTVALLLATLAGLIGWAQLSSAAFVRESLPAQRRLVAVLSLTDLALWSEARYTRHPSMTDLFSPFQDHPGAPEHFPAGALLAPTGPRPATTIEVRRRSEGGH